MNESQSDDEKLDAMLRTWSREHATHSGSIDRLYQRISASLPQSVAVHRPQHGHRTVATVCSAALCLLVALFATSSFNKQSQMAGEQIDSRTQLIRLWNKTSEVFGSDLKWICDLDGELLLGVTNDIGSNEPGSIQGVADRVCLLLTLREFDPVTRKWINSWTGHISCPSGASIDFASTDHRTAGSIWIQPRPDGRFSVYNWFSWKDHPEVSGPIEGSVSSNESRIVSDRVLNGRHVQVVQQIWRPGVG